MSASSPVPRRLHRRTPSAIQIVTTLLQITNSSPRSRRDELDAPWYVIPHNQEAPSRNPRETQRQLSASTHEGPPRAFTHRFPISQRAGPIAKIGRNLSRTLRSMFPSKEASSGTQSTHSAFDDRELIPRKGTRRHLRRNSPPAVERSRRKRVIVRSCDELST